VKGGPGDEIADDPRGRESLATRDQTGAGGGGACLRVLLGELNGERHDGYGLRRCLPVQCFVDRQRKSEELTVVAKPRTTGSDSFLTSGTRWKRGGYSGIAENRAFADLTHSSITPDPDLA
jgi:hypothetical protein